MHGAGLFPQINTAIGRLERARTPKKTSQQAKPRDELPVRLFAFQEHGRRGRRLVAVTVRDRFLRDLLYSYRRQHIIRDHTEYLYVSEDLLLFL